MSITLLDFNCDVPGGGGGGGGDGATVNSVETVLVGAVEGSADVVSVVDLKSAATSTESPTETPF